nr:hypothetical protein GCM10020063_000780 [Dactylosporangium thailandense]
MRQLRSAARLSEPPRRQADRPGVAGRNPASGVTWLGKSATAAALRALVAAPKQPTHEAID